MGNLTCLYVNRKKEVLLRNECILIGYDMYSIVGLSTVKYKYDL